MRSRRALLAGIAALAVARPAAAQEAKSVEAVRVFQYLGNYLGLPAAERTRFRLSYILQRDGKPLTVPVFLVLDGKRTQLPLDREGRVLRLPTVDQVRRGKLEVAVPAEAKLNAKLVVEPIARPAVRMDARDLALAVDQAATGLKKAAGMMAMAVPTLKQVEFVGVPSGEVELADGRRAPLPLDNSGRPTFEPAKWPAARAVRFRRAPQALRFGS